MDKAKPIGVFDSGVGGLTVIKRLTSILPNENLVYFGDTARVPYGSKSKQTIIEYAIQASNFLIKKNVKAIVVACNTVSSVAMEILKEKFNIPFIGMIEPGAKFATQFTKNKRVGVIGTNATVLSSAYSYEIKKQNPFIDVYEKACPLFVPLAEEGWINHSATKIIAKEYLKEFKELKIDTLILGCTHYPILADTIQTVMGKKVTLIDSGIAAAREVQEVLNRLDLKTNSGSLGMQDYYVSDMPNKFKNIAELFLGNELKYLQKVELDVLKQLSD